jgi:hypothetical protein
MMRDRAGLRRSALAVMMAAVRWPAARVRRRSISIAQRRHGRGAADSARYAGRASLLHRAGGKRAAAGGSQPAGGDDRRRPRRSAGTGALGSPPSAEIGQALSLAISGELGTIDVFRTPTPDKAPVYRISTNVQRFESAPGQYALIDAVWSVRQPAASKC